MLHLAAEGGAALQCVRYDPRLDCVQVLELAGYLGAFGLPPSAAQGCNTLTRWVLLYGALVAEVLRHTDPPPFPSTMTLP